MMKACRQHVMQILVPLLLGTSIGIGCGLLGAVFLHALIAAESTRASYSGLVYGLPVLGLLLGIIYTRYGRTIAAGNNLIIDRLCDGGPAIPPRMVPINLLGTVAIHLFGGSVGQEGTAMQLGAAWADTLCHKMGLQAPLRPQCLAAGVAGGFSAVFGAPAAAAVFALEFAVAGTVRSALLPAVATSALTARFVAHALGAVRPAYPNITVAPLTLPTALGWLMLAAALSAAAALFIRLTDAIRHVGALKVPSLPIRMLLGGLATIGFTWMVQTPMYLGGGLEVPTQALADGPIPPYAWLLKLILTAVCLGTGFGGGEVTPLFFMGATLGHTLGPWLGLPSSMAAAMGMVAILSSATRAPIAWMLLCVELIGPDMLPAALLTCTFAAICGGTHRIYQAQRGFGAEAA